MLCLWRFSVTICEKGRSYLLLTILKDQGTRRNLQIFLVYSALVYLKTFKMLTTITYVKTLEVQKSPHIH